MIITRTPLRISLGGGGTDVPSYYRASGGGFLIAAAISKYVYIAVNKNFDPDILLKYSMVERIARPEDAEHPLLRECLIEARLRSAIEISSMADIPAGTGLGSSGAFTVGVLKALHAFKHENIPNEQIAARACEIEIERLQQPIGKQDQYIAAVGGLTAFKFRTDDSVEIIPLALTEDVRHRVEDNLLLFFTGMRRPASEALALEQSGRSASGKQLEKNLDDVRAIGYETMHALTGGDLTGFGELLTAQWELKFDRSPSDIHDTVDGWIREGIAAGALGGKLVGAGGGGFLLFYAPDEAELRNAMNRLGLTEVRFAIDYQGTSTIVAG